jgi:hypothetical protein
MWPETPGPGRSSLLIGLSRVYVSSIKLVKWQAEGDIKLKSTCTLKKSLPGSFTMNSWKHVLVDGVLGHDCGDLQEWFEPEPDYLK